MTTPPKRSLLFINIGSPRSASAADVGRYLREFLTDPRIIPLPYLMRHLLVKGIIVPFRAGKSAKRYELIWQEEGAPLDIYTHRLADKVSRITNLPAYVTMRYTAGDTAERLMEMERDGVGEVILVPLFPQYAMSSFESSVAHVHKVYEQGRRSGKYGFGMSTITPFYAHSGYIDALAERLAPELAPGDHLLCSFHGIPMDQVLPYRNSANKNYLAHCDATIRLLLEHPLLAPIRERITHEQVYQSRFDNRKWLSPTLVGRLTALPAEGKKRVVVISPTFICDCLETIEEIGIMGREIFMQNGGESFTLIPAPNDSDTMARAFADMVTQGTHTPLSRWICKD